MGGWIGGRVDGWMDNASAAHVDAVFVHVKEVFGVSTSSVYWFMITSKLSLSATCCLVTHSAMLRLHLDITNTRPSTPQHNSAAHLLHAKLAGENLSAHTPPEPLA